MSVSDREVDKIWNKLRQNVPEGEALLDEAGIAYLSTQELWELKGRLYERDQINTFWQPRLIALAVGSPILFVLAMIAGISGFTQQAAILIKMFPWCVGFFVLAILGLYKYSGGQQGLQDKQELIAIELKRRSKGAHFNPKSF